MAHELTLPGNPHQLTIAQHIFPRSAIQRFADADGMVQVERFASPAPFRVRPDNNLFCARRAWDQTTETMRSWPTEQAYATLANRIVLGDVRTLTAQMDTVVTEFYLLWNHRHNIAALAPADSVLNLVAPEPPRTKAEEEILESKGYIFARGNVIPSRFINGLTIMRENDRGMLAMQGKHWGIVRAVMGEFLVPDNTATLTLIPVSPSICLSMESDDVELEPAGVGFVNRHLIDCARSYGWALLACCINLRNCSTSAAASRCARNTVSRSVWAALYMKWA